MKSKLSLVFLVGLIFCCTRKEQFYDSKFLMDTFCEIKVVSDKPVVVRRAISEVFKEVELLDRKFGFTDESEIVRINLSSGKNWYRVSDETFFLIKKSIEISNLTKGAFDITTGVLTSLWGFENFSKKTKFTVPSQEEIRKSLSLVGYNNIIVDETNKRVFLKHKNMKINLGGIAKGYAIKRAKEILESYGLKDFLINFGGDIYTSGKRKDGLPWRIAVQHPRDKNKFLCVLELSNISCATSGDYERYFIVDNIRYHHILDPSTGYPKKDIISVTVLCEDPVLADALATGIFVLGEIDGLNLANKLGIDCIIVKQENDKLKLYTTQKFEKLEFNL